MTGALRRDRCPRTDRHMNPEEEEEGEEEEIEEGEGD